MSDQMDRLRKIEPHIKRYAEESGLLTADIDFEVVSVQRMLEAMAYMFPTNYSFWLFGRDYERQRMIYERTGGGIPYEVVWNFDRFRAFLVRTNPVILNITTMAHVYGHVDCFLGNTYLQNARTLDVAEEAREAALRFAKYEERYGQEVERVIGAGMSIMWHQNPDPFYREQDDETVRAYLLELEHRRIQESRETKARAGKSPTPQEIATDERRLAELSARTPPEPVYDLLWYIINYSPKPLKPWMKDVLTVVRNQARCLAPQRRTKMLNEGWASFWHSRFMKRLLDDGLITGEEHGIYNSFNKDVLYRSTKQLNPYRLGSAVFEYIKERGDQGRFGPEYDKCTDPFKKADWDTGAGKGLEHILKVRAQYNDRMLVERFFTDEFILQQQLHLFQTFKDNNEPDQTYHMIADDRPQIIRDMLTNAYTDYGIPQISVQDGNWEGKNQLLLRHHFTGYELDPAYRNGTLAALRYLWNRPVYLETVEDGEPKIVSVDGEGRAKAKSRQ